MKLKAITEACLWLPGFAPDEDPIITLGTVGEHKETGAILPFPQISETKAQAAVKAIWPRLDASVFAGLSGDATKFEANIAAIELLRKLESEERLSNYSKGPNFLHERSTGQLTEKPRFLLRGPGIFCRSESCRVPRRLGYP